MIEKDYDEFGAFAVGIFRIVLEEPVFSSAYFVYRLEELEI